MLNLIFLHCITKLCSSRFSWIATLNWERIFPNEHSHVEYVYAMIYIDTGKR